MVTTVDSLFDIYSRRLYRCNKWCSPYQSGVETAGLEKSIGNLEESDSSISSVLIMSLYRLLGM